jgi:phage baseplate assembly protein gpV
MAYNSTTWAEDSLTAATALTTTAQDATVSGDLTVTGADIVLGDDSDGTDRTVIFGHSTLKTIMGIDDSADRFVINTDASFDGTIADNDFSIDSSSNAYILGDLTVTGGKISFGNGAVIDNEDSPNVLKFRTENAYHFSVTDAVGDLNIILEADGGIDGDNVDVNRLKSADGGTISFQNYEGGSYSTSLSISKDGNLTVAGDLTITGGDITAGANSTTQGTLKLWDGGSGNTPGYIVLYSPNGTANYIFCEDDGTLKRHTSAPTANGDGSEIGGQS